MKSIFLNFQILNEKTDVSYQVSQDGPGGMIAARDFVTLRHHARMPDGTDVIAWVSVKHREKPVQPHIVRYLTLYANNQISSLNLNLPPLFKFNFCSGTNGIGGWLLYPSTSMPNSGFTDFQWVLDVELELSKFIPTTLVDSAVLSAAMTTISALRLKLAGRLNAIENQVTSEQVPLTARL